MAGRAGRRAGLCGKQIVVARGDGTSGAECQFGEAGRMGQSELLVCLLSPSESSTARSAAVQPFGLAGQCKWQQLSACS